RERLCQLGPEYLSDAELLAIILRVGNKGQSAFDLAKEILISCQGVGGLDAKSVSELCQIRGIGMAKAAQIKAAMEIGKRLRHAHSSQRARFRNSREVFDYMQLKLRHQPREQFYVLLLTIRNKLILEKKLFEGTLHESIVNPREVVKLAVNEQAAGVIFVHNHPSGEPTPSKDDLDLTKRLQRACETVEIRVLDHVIVGGDRFFSFADEALL
ncbi:MAG: RadC family protein, partial [bacterium]